MATCRYCGKKGLFVHVNQIGMCSECAEKQSRKDTTEARIAAIYQEFQKAIDLPTIDARIAHYETLLKKYDSEPNMSSYRYKLAELYRVGGQLDNAWAMLNRVHSEAMNLLNKNGDQSAYKHMISKIRWQQYEILTAEQKYIDAVRCLSVYYLYSGVNHDAYVRRAGIIARKGGMKTAHVKEITAQLEDFSKSGIDEAVFNDWFQQYIDKLKKEGAVL